MPHEGTSQRSSNLGRGLVLIGLLVAFASVALARDVASATGLRATIHLPEDIASEYLVRDGDRLWLRHPAVGDLELAAEAPDRRDLVTPSADAVAAALSGVQGFRADIHVDVFILPAFPREVPSSFALRDAIFLAPAFGEQAAEVLAYTVVHELGHVLTWAAIDGRPARWQAYRDQRGLAVQDDPASLPHADRHREILAEDFRALFGGPLATASGTIENADLPHPDQVDGLRDLLVGFLAAAAGAADRQRPSSVYPNPCRDQARVELVLSDGAAKAGPARPLLEIYDVRGRLVRRLTDGAVANGRATVTWDGRGRDGRRLPGGIYLYRVTAAGDQGSGRLLLLDR